LVRCYDGAHVHGTAATEAAFCDDDGLALIERWVVVRFIVLGIVGSTSPAGGLRCLNSVHVPLFVLGERVSGAWVKGREVGTIIHEVWAVWEGHSQLVHLSFLFLQEHIVQRLLLFPLRSTIILFHMIVTDKFEQV
jgi:hypothetical protein